MRNWLTSLQAKPALIVAGLWVFFQFLWYLRFGFVFGFEAPKYIYEAHHLLAQGRFSQFRYIFYVTTIAVIAVAKLLGLGVQGALLGIMAFNLFCYLVFFTALRRFFGATLPALAVVALLLSFWPFQSWTMYLFTECFFYSVVLLLLAHLLNFRSLTLRFLLHCAALLLLLTLSRPLGILFVPPVLLFIFYYLSKKQKVYFVLAGLGFFVALNFVVQVVFTTTSDWNMTRALTEESLICDIPRGDASRRLDLTSHPNQFYQMVYYVTHNFLHFAGLALTRLRYFFGMTRTYYSAGHNGFLLVYLALFYGSLVFGWKQVRTVLPPAMRAFLFSVVAIFAVTVALQCDDYHNRFFLTLTPLFALTTVAAWRPVIGRVGAFLKSRTG